jgi:hypothetical protein
MNAIRRSAPLRGPAGLRIGLILLLLLGAPLNLAMPDTMSGPAMAAAMTGAHGQDCPEPGSAGGDHGTPGNHSGLCLFCTALGGPSLAGASVEPTPEVSPTDFATLSFDLADRTLPDERSARTQYSRGPPAVV